MKMLTTSEAATRLGVTVQRVHQLIKEELLPAQKVGRDYIINETDLELVSNRRSVGRPPKVSPAPETPATGQPRRSKRGSGKKAKQQ